MTALRTDATAPPPPVIRPHLPLGVVVAIACVAQFMVVLDTAIVNVALPAMRADLGLTTGAQQWVVDIYLLTFGGLLLLAARAGDLFGRKMVFQFGLVLFTAGSLLGGLAVNGPMLLIARAVQGVGAAALAPASLSLITATHHEAHHRARALAMWGAAASSAGAVGVVLGGVLTDELNWRWVLFVNVPVGAALCVAVAICLLPRAEIPAGTPRTRLDVPGALTVTVGVGALVYGISQATERGWGSASVLGSLAAAIVLIGVFLLIETRTAAPLLRLNMFRLRNLRTANLVMFCLGATLTAVLFFLSLYLQQLLGYSAIRTGLALLPMSAVLAAGSLFTRRLVAAGIHGLPVYGSLIAAGAMVWLTQLPAHPAYLANVFGPTVLAGAGFSLIVLPVTIAATAGVPHHEAGAASGLLNVARQIGGAIGLASLVTVASAATSSARHTHAELASTLHGYHVALLVAAGISVLAAIAAANFRRA